VCLISHSPLLLVKFTQHTHAGHRQRRRGRRRKRKRKGEGGRGREREGEKVLLGYLSCSEILDPRSNFP
jgi:hypothetical protein